MEWRWTDGYDVSEFSKTVSISDSYALKDDEKQMFVNVTCSAASKTLTLGLPTGQNMILTNIGGSNAITIKNVAGDTGTSLAAGKTALVYASQTADASKVLVLN